jgi:hypothetical protein
MYDGQGEIVGLQQRFDTGRKVCYPGSKLGLFLPNAPLASSRARPKIDYLVVVPDNDDAGQSSASRMLTAAGKEVSVSTRWLPSGFKDLRELYQAEGRTGALRYLSIGDCSSAGYVCEGLSDAVVAHHLGFYAIGLPSATSGHEKVVGWVLSGKSNGTK